MACNEEGGARTMSRTAREGQGLSRERIVAAAIEIADAEGLDAVSMRRIADQLGSGTMSLYRHVAGKDDLTVAMTDAVTSAYAYPAADGLDWRERMYVLARHDWNMYEAHPWLLFADMTATPPFGPAGLRAMEWALSALEPLGLPLEESARAIMTINKFLQGSARSELSERTGGTRPEADPVDPGSRWQARLAGVDLTDHPRLRELAALQGVGAGRPWFDSGLELILDGIEARSRAVAGPSGATG
ncbi:TetR/AcrR family transcriptional regulator [Actinoalloteichus fjordicus]|uniref:Transcriptional regulator, TetR family n=1 Tax=Actinoalloteichus fjordicus TaxID=1612552 RepID=A0AAC9LGZ3_9PSEU|nr:TetR/AcrR family transcriptional regulator [Actinoalloteichus fjordicus]APU16592.1 transcriptional regulator, TetR family [Actinoalloteichus fjordicus]